MKHALRNIGGMLAGLVVAVIVIAVIEAIAHRQYPPPEGFDPSDPQAVKEFVATLPAAAFAYVLVAYFVGTLAGTSLAAWLNRGRQRAPGITVGGLLLASAVVNFLSVPHPFWFVVASLVAFPLATYLSVRFVARS